MKEFNKREAIEDLFMRQQPPISTWDYFQRSAWEISVEMAIAEAEGENVLSITDRCEEAIGAYEDVADEADIKKFYSMINSPFFKRMSLMYDEWIIRYNERKRSRIITKNLSRMGGNSRNN